MTNLHCLISSSLWTIGNGWYKLIWSIFQTVHTQNVQKFYFMWVEKLYLWFYRFYTHHSVTVISNGITRLRYLALKVLRKNSSQLTFLVIGSKSQTFSIPGRMLCKHTGWYWRRLWWDARWRKSWLGLLTWIFFKAKHAMFL